MNVEPLLQQAVECGDREWREAKPFLEGEPVGDRSKHDLVDDACRGEHRDARVHRASPEKLERACGRRVEPLQVVDRDDYRALARQ